MSIGNNINRMALHAAIALSQFGAVLFLIVMFMRGDAGWWMYLALGVTQLGNLRRIFSAEL